MRYNNLISPLTTLYENLWHQSMYYVSYMTLYEIQEIFQLQWKIKIIQQFLVFEFFCMILVWFLGSHIWSLYDYQEFIQIIYDLVWLLRIIYDLVRNQRKFYDRWPGNIRFSNWFINQPNFVIYQMIINSGCCLIMSKIISQRQNSLIFGSEIKHLFSLRAEMARSSRKDIKFGTGAKLGQ